MQTQPLARPFDYLEVDGYIVDEIVIDGVNVSKFDLQPLSAQTGKAQPYSLCLTDEDRRRMGI